MFVAWCSQCELLGPEARYESCIFAALVFPFTALHCFKKLIVGGDKSTYLWILGKFWMNFVTVDVCFVNKFNNQLY